LKFGSMTSGRRTIEGNRDVGGVADSDHLTGDAADFAGPDLVALLREVRETLRPDGAFIHNGNHVHAKKKGWGVPYYGKRGTKGLKR
jgi:uncharacterized protein YcbK (DUF882 family)